MLTFKSKDFKVKYATLCDNKFMVFHLQLLYVCNIIYSTASSIYVLILGNLKIWHPVEVPIYHTPQWSLVKRAFIVAPETGFKSVIEPKICQRGN